MMILATFDSNIDDKIITIIFDKYSLLSCVDMNGFVNIYDDRVIISNPFRRIQTLAVTDK